MHKHFGSAVIAYSGVHYQLEAFVFQRDHVHRSPGCPHREAVTYRLRVLVLQARVNGDYRAVKREIDRLYGLPAGSLGAYGAVILRLYLNDWLAGTQRITAAQAVERIGDLLVEAVRYADSKSALVGDMLTLQIKYLLWDGDVEAARAALQDFRSTLNRLLGQTENQPQDDAAELIARTFVAYALDDMIEAEGLAHQANDCELLAGSSPCYKEFVTTLLALTCTVNGRHEEARRLMEGLGIPIHEGDQFWDPSRPELLAAMLKWFGLHKLD